MRADRFLDGRVTLHSGDCLAVLAELSEASIDACVTDPPYHLTSIVKRFGSDGSREVKTGAYGGGFDPKGNGTGAAFARMSRGFMGKQWDGGEIAFEPETWAAVYRVLKPGGHLLAFGAPKNFGFMQVAIANAGFEVRDVLCWIFGSGFPKSHDVSKGIDRAAGAERNLTRAGVVKRNGYGDDWDTGSSEDRPRYDEAATDAARQWSGWGSSLKPAYEPIIMARKPLIGTIAENVLKHGTGAINIQACRVVSHDNPNSSISCTCYLHGDDQSSHTDDMGNQASSVSLHLPQNNRSPNDFSNELHDQQSLDSPNDCLAFGDSCDERTRSDAASDQGPSASQDDVHKPPALHAESQRNRNYQSKTCPVHGTININVQGRWPANVILDGSEEVVEGFPETSASPPVGSMGGGSAKHSIFGDYAGVRHENGFGDSGSAARFFYTAKADSDDRLGSKHPTVKPLDLMQYLVRLICPKGGTILDCFAGTGTTGEAAYREGMNAVLIEAEPEYQTDIRRRMALVLSGPNERSYASIKARGLTQSPGPLFDPPYDADDDIRKSVAEGFQAIRDRKADGGKGWGD